MTRKDLIENFKKTNQPKGFFRYRVMNAINHFTLFCQLFLFLIFFRHLFYMIIYSVIIYIIISTLLEITAKVKMRCPLCNKKFKIFRAYIGTDLWYCEKDQIYFDTEIDNTGG